MSRLKALALPIMLLALCLFGQQIAFAGTASAYTNPIVAGAFQDTACGGLDEVGGTKCGSKDNGINTVTGAIVKILSLVAGILAVIMVLVAGFKYITSGGDANKVSSAKTTLIYALIGVAVAVLAQVLVHFVVNTSINGTKTSYRIEHGSSHMT